MNLNQINRENLNNNQKDKSITLESKENSNNTENEKIIIDKNTFDNDKKICLNKTYDQTFNSNIEYIQDEENQLS
jgi:hypothetical protein